MTNTFLIDESMLKRVLVGMAGVSGKIKNTADIAKLKFGEDCSVPTDLLFNDVPHPAWVSLYHHCLMDSCNVILIGIIHCVSISLYGANVVIP